MHEYPLLFWKALEMANKQEWSNVIIESNALNVINAVNKRDNGALHWASEYCFSDILLCLTNFVNLILVWVLRTANRLAHFVSKWAGTQCFCGLVEPD